jgi:voltage-gated potassium channel
LRRPRRSPVNELRQFRGPILLLALTLAFGVLGYIVLEGWSFLDAIFMTVTTITTVGYGEVHPLSAPGRVFTIVLIIVGVGGALYTFGALVGWLLAFDSPERQRRRRVERALGALRDHFIICGYGRVGRGVVEVLQRERVPFVVVDVNQASLATAEEHGLLAVFGDGTSDEVLRRAGIERARGLITAVDSDANNVYVVLSARGLRPDLLIVARASTDEAAQKLERAGATHVLSPYSMAGRQMAMLAVKPTAVELAETLLHAEGGELVVEEVLVTDGSALVGVGLGQLRRQGHDAPMIVAVRHGGNLVASPPDDYRLRTGDRLVAIGNPTQLRELEKLL